MYIAIASDHAGVALKEQLKEFLKEMKIESLDFGSNSSDPVDYPDFAKQVCDAVNKKRCDLGILVDSSGLGMSIAANKCKGIRCALCYNDHTAMLARNHNDANVLALGSKMLDAQKAKDIVKIFVNTNYSKEERHNKRINKIARLEQEYAGCK
jgi:ribose 5-phosphate isomerase B